MTWIQIAPTAGASFLASAVECVEAATIVLAVGTVRGWRSALVGAGLGLAALAGLVLALGSALSHLPERPLQLAVGVLLLLFGMRWLRKAILRAAGVIPLHDEDAVFRSETANLRLVHVSQRHGVDPIAMATVFKAVLLEGVEVAFIVLAVSAGGPDLLAAAVAGALAAALLVTLAAVAVHRPLARVPENTLKFAVGVVSSAFGIYWSSEGLGVTWPGHDFALPAIAGGLLATALMGVRLAGRPGCRVGNTLMGATRAVLAEIVHLFVDDGSLALALVAWCAAVGAAVLLMPSLLLAPGPALFLGCAAILLGNVVRAARVRADAVVPR